MLDLHKLATLRAVLVHGSFSKAAGALNLTQPAVSRQVSLLERQLGIRLVRRTQRGVYPTEAGHALAEHTEIILGQLALAESHMREFAGLRRGTVRLGSFFTALVHLSAELAVLLEEQHPGLVIADTLADRNDALAALAGGELDVAVVFEHDFERAATPGEAVELLPLFDDPVRVLLPATHRLADRERVPLHELADEVWIRAHDGSAARLLDRVLAAGQLMPRILLAGHGDEPIESQALVASAKGITIAHELNVLLNPDQLAVRPLAGYTGCRHIQVATMRDGRTALVRAVRDALLFSGQRRSGPSRCRRSSADHPR